MSAGIQEKSGNAPEKRDMLGTLMPGLLAGHRRYAHGTALRGDTLAAQALGAGHRRQRQAGRSCCAT